ncbi:rho GDP-dissociation inhibitor 1-like isoform X1 [Lycium ferocissimum]|uniref:rho GDP-dissociation inhibitor 1-like isoform X1 n=1 Tax=Lycium ferocissimum TaxID=112874 RepID=UPI0028158381|nr:rho GDP-dissociation inhibitor 1-like isoform X1 [Lycium ferocissimum]
MKMSAVVEPISPNKALIMDTLMNEDDQQEKMKMQDDESLREEQLLGSDHSSSDGVQAEKELEPEVQQPKLYIICPGRSDLELSEPFISTPKDCLFTLKEASRYKLKFSFTVSNNVVSGLKYINTTWKSGVRVDKSQVMLGTFSPRKEPYVYELEEDVTPSGVFARGLYTARTQVIDEKERCYVDIKYYFDIQKQWRESS